jgi:hypothetical protein
MAKFDYINKYSEALDLLKSGGIIKPSFDCNHKLTHAQIGKRYLRKDVLRKLQEQHQWSWILVNEYPDPPAYKFCQCGNCGPDTHAEIEEGDNA